MLPSIRATCSHVLPCCLIPSNSLFAQFILLIVVVCIYYNTHTCVSRTRTNNLFFGVALCVCVYRVKSTTSMAAEQFTGLMQKTSHRAMARPSYASKRMMSRPQMEMRCAAPPMGFASSLSRRGPQMDFFSAGMYVCVGVCA